jgi:Cu-processing system permease protein
MNVKTVAILAGQEVRDAVRHRWFVLYALAFAALAIGLAYVSLLGSGSLGFAAFDRTTAGLVNLVLLLVPLMGLTIGGGAIARERESGTLAYLLAQPVTRGELLAGKFTGLGTALIAAICLGFGLSGVVIAWQAGTGDVASFLALVGLSAALALAMLSLGLLVSALSRRGSVAIGIAVFLWLVLAFVSDLGLMGGAIAFKLEAGSVLQLALINPLQAFKLSVLSNIETTLEVLGPAGMYASETYGNALPWLLGGALGTWIVAPLLLAWGALARRDLM